MQLVSPRYLESGYMWLLFVVGVFTALYGNVLIASLLIGFSLYALVMPAFMFRLAEHVHVDLTEELKLFPNDDAVYVLKLISTAKVPLGVVRLSGYLHPTVESEAHAFWRQENFVETNATVDFTIPLHAKKRGPIRLEAIGMEIRDPLRMFSLYKEDTLPRIGYVFPEFSPYPIPKRPPTLPGEEMVRHSAYRDPETFQSVTPYHGQPMRQLYWSAYAKTGELLARTEQPVQANEYVIVLDLLTKDGRALTYQMERLISQAAALCRDFEKENASYGLIVPTLTKDGITYDLPPGSGEVHFRKIMTTFACLSESDFPLARSLFERKVAKYSGNQSILRLGGDGQ